MESSIDIGQLTKEVLVSSDRFGQFWNVCVWDHTSGTNLQTYKNCATVTHGLDFLKQDYMLCAVHNKPYITYWPLKAKTNQPSKINTPGFVTSLCVSNCGNYICFSIEEKAFVVQAHAGRTIAIIAKHLQNISCMRFSGDDRYLITGGDDTFIYVWDFREVLNVDKEHLKPTFTWNAHSMKITDLFVSVTNNRVVSASADQTCKFWSLTSEKPFATESILLDSKPNTCMLDHLESHFYVGLANGNIISLPIKYILHESNKLVRDDSHNRTFVGHKQIVNCMSISEDDLTLASGSEDTTIRIWDTCTRQCIKIINHTGPVTNVAFKHRTLFFNDEPSIASPLFSRYATESSSANVACEISLVVGKRRQQQQMQQVNNKLDLHDFLDSDYADGCQEEYFELKSKYENMKKINEKIYNYAVEKILDS